MVRYHTSEFLGTYPFVGHLNKFDKQRHGSGNRILAVGNKQPAGNPRPDAARSDRVLGLARYSQALRRAGMARILRPAIRSRRTEIRRV